MSRDHDARSDLPTAGAQDMRAVIMLLDVMNAVIYAAFRRLLDRS